MYREGTGTHYKKKVVTRLATMGRAPRLLSLFLLLSAAVWANEAEESLDELPEDDDDLEVVVVRHDQG